MNTNDIIKSLGMVSPSEMPPRLINEIHTALTERDALQDKLDDFNESYANVIAERCAGDEQHCTCVPFLRMELETLRTALRDILAGAQRTAVPGGYEYTLSGRVTTAAQSAISKTETGE